jgi:hypothetical protein
LRRSPGGSQYFHTLLYLPVLRIRIRIILPETDPTCFCGIFGAYVPTLTRYAYLYKVRYTDRPAKSTCVVQLRIRGTVTPTRYSYSYEVQPHQQISARPTRYSCTLLTRYIYTYEAHPQLRTSSYTCVVHHTCEVHLHL